MRTAPLLLAALLTAGCRDEASGTGTRAHITAVGSSTVYPFTTLIAEQFVASRAGAQAPVIEATGTGAGMKLFCAGVGAAYPDISDASRRIKPSEYRDCARNGAGALLEIRIGVDGIAFAEANAGPPLALTLSDVYRALAATPGGKPNSTRTWHDVNARLPDVPITVYGPPATSGTRDALAELMLTPGCEAAEPGARALAPAPRAALCTRVREDGAYVDAGENDNLIVQKLRSNPQAIGVLGWSYLEENARTVRGVAIDGVRPSYDTIAGGRYPGARPLYLYVKKAHLDPVPGLRDFLRLYAAAWDPGGPLTRQGLIAAPDKVRAHSAAVIAQEIALDPAELR